MKKKTLTILALLFVFTSMFSLFVEIGDGTTTTNYFPSYGYYDNSWSNYILTSDQIGDAIEINQIQFNVGNTPANYEMVDQKLYLKLVTETEVAVAYPAPETNGFTLVFDGSITYNGGGWQGVFFDTPFAYDGTSNLQIVWENRDGSYSTGYPNVLKTDVETNVAAYKYADNDFPAIDGTNVMYYPNTRLGYAVADEPTPVTMIAPIDGATDVALATDLSWEMGENTVAVDVYLSSDYEMVNTMDASAMVVDNQNVTTYSASLEEWTNYYWKVVSRSSADFEVASPISSFSTVLPEGTVQVGYGELTNQSLPIEPFYGFTYSQSIYNQEDINTNGAITSLAWHYNGNSAWGPDTIAVYMATTEIDTFETTESWVAYDQLTLVYEGALSVEAVDGWVQIELDTPFNYDNTQNLLVAVEENTAGYHSSSDEFYCSEAANGKSITFRSDSNNPDPMDPPTGILKAAIPNVIFNFGDEVVEEFPAPSNLMAEVVDDVNVNLSWNMPILPEDEGTWMYYGDGVNNDGFGIGSAAELVGAIRFDTDDLASYDGSMLSKVRFFPRVADATYTVKVWTGGSSDGTTFNPGTEVFTQAAEGIAINEWNILEMATPLTIDASQELWIGIHADTPNGYPIGMDAGPAVAGKGDIYMYMNAWGSASTLGAVYDRNFSIQGMIGGGRVMYRDPIEITGYNIYRNSTIITSVMGAADTTYVDADLNDGSYEYKVTALYGTDESNPTNLVSVVIDTAPPVYNPAQNLTAEVVNEMDVELNWDAPAERRFVSRFQSQLRMEYASAYTRDLTGYEIYKDGAMLTTVGADVLTYTDAGLEYGTYEYYVIATYTEANAEPSNTATVTLAEEEEILPPANLTAAAMDDDIVLNWSAPAQPSDPSAESFEGEFPPTDWTNVQTNTTKTWEQVETVTFTDGDVVPTDGTYQAMCGWDYSAQDEWLITPAVANVSSMTFDFYGQYGSTEGDNYYVKVSTDGGNNWTALWNASDEPEGANHFDTPITIDLSAYASETINVAWQCVDGDGQGLWWTTFIDNVVMSDGRNEIRIPGTKLISVSKVKKVETTRIDRELTGYKIYKDGTFLMDVDASTLTYTDADLAEGTYEYYVTAMYGAEESEASNTASATIANAEYILQDSFESYDDFALEMAPWTLVDNDLNATYGFQGTTFPNTGAMMAYIVFNPNSTTPVLDDAAFLANTGEKYAACFAAMSPSTQNDDWMMTPVIELAAGGSFSFMAKSYTHDYGAERFNVLVSDGSTNPDDFTSISGVTYTEAPLAWTNFSYDLSAYANSSIRLAIQCVSNDAFIFMVDDVAINAPGGTPTVNNEVPAVSMLQGNYPNPFNPETTIAFSTKENGPVSIDIFNVKGQKVRTLVNDNMEAGNHTVVWNGQNDNGKNVASGVFFYRMKSGKYSSTKKMILMK